MVVNAALGDALTEYQQRRDTRRAQVLAFERDERRISALRLLVFGAAVVLGVLVWRDVASAWWLLIPLAAFAVLVRRHDRIIRAREDAQRAEAFYERGLARVEDRWVGTGESGERFRDDEHLYANDLDLFGRGSLFELLSIARTRAGEETLAAWLKTPASSGEIRARHEAVVELTGALDLRERLAVAGATVRAGVHPDALVAWAEAPPELPGALQKLAVAATALTLSTAAVWAFSGEYLPFLVAIVIQSAVQHRHRARIEGVLHRAEAPARDLTVLLHLVRRIEDEPLRARRLVALRREVAQDGPAERPAEGRPAASAAIRRLERLVEAHDWEHNLVFTIVAMLLMWGTHIACAIERWRAAHGGHARRWLQAIGELEALSSLSAYRYEHPEDPFPEVIDRLDRQGATFAGVSLGHPLLPSGRMVRNDVHLTDGHSLLVVSGSNMSGKSTLLRTVGINAVLAFAGAPVRAAALRITPLSIGATLRIQDSLQEGRSRFYAEITRIRAIVDLADGDRPLLFLLDELFHGTNSHDRLVGASGVLRSLLDRGAIGLITTHDLALTAIVEELAPRARNVHFEDRFETGDLTFDYRMKPGPVTRSNAIALMRAVGLDIPTSPGTP